MDGKMTKGVFGVQLDKAAEHMAARTGMSSFQVAAT
jgi:hypothetical protein